MKEIGHVECTPSAPPSIFSQIPDSLRVMLLRLLLASVPQRAGANRSSGLGNSVQAAMTIAMAFPSITKEACLLRGIHRETWSALLSVFSRSTTRRATSSGIVRPETPEHKKSGLTVTEVSI